MLNDDAGPPPAEYSPITRTPVMYGAPPAAANNEVVSSLVIECGHSPRTAAIRCPQAVPLLGCRTDLRKALRHSSRSVMLPRHFAVPVRAVPPEVPKTAARVNSLAQPNPV